MRRTRRRIAAAALVALAVLGPAGRASAQGDAERLRSAKALFFDRKYGEARQVWQQILSSSRGAEADVAAFWIARCSENLGERERAFQEYGAFLERRPTDRALAAEARTARIGVASRLHKEGRPGYLKTLTDGLGDKAKSVRYYAALQLSALGPDHGRAAVPLLQRILAEESDPDLLDRAKLGLLRLDPSALSRSVSAPPAVSVPQAAAEGRAPGRWINLRIFERGESRPHVSLSLPLALAELLFKSLPEDAKRELRREGYDADNFWEKVRGLGKGRILDIEGDSGEKIQLWIE